MKSFVIAILCGLFCTNIWANTKVAEDFTLRNFECAAISLSDYKGQVVYLDFWASWCKPCVASFPKLEALQQKYGNHGFTVLAINLDENKANALAFLQKHPVTYPVLYDKDAKVAESYQVAAMPSSYFIDKKGNIRLSHRGFVPGDEVKIEKAIQFLLKEK